jgi:CubicO group peptidase (beta-lactamase class C family)
MKKHLPCASFLCLLAWLHVTPSFAGDEPPASPEVTVAMQPYLDSYKLAGIIAIIADKTGRVHYKNLLGSADVEAKKPISEDNVFWVASMTKMFVGASIMMLVDEGKVSLDDPVTNYIPQLRNGWWWKKRTPITFC